MTEAMLPKASMPDPAAAPEPPRATALARSLRRMRWSILWERLWPVLAGLATLVGLFLVVSWLGVWLLLPPLARAVGVLAFAALLAAALLPLLRLRMPGVGEGLRRLDQASGLRHRPATAVADGLAVSAQDPFSQALWNAHLDRARQAVRSFRAVLPSPRIARRDPYALRGLVLLTLIATFFAAGGDRARRIAAAFDWDGVVVPANFRVDAWVVPPLYTGKPPVVLPGLSPGAAFAQLRTPVAVPVNSTLVVRATGKVDVDVSGSGGVVPAKEAVHAPAGTDEHRFTVVASGAARLRGAGDDASWAFNAIADQPPSVALTKDPQEESRGALLLSYRLEDDYGVTKAEATFARKAGKGGKGGGKGGKGGKGAAGDQPSAHPLYGPPAFALILPQARTKKGSAQTIKDLTDHPWAGAEVTMTLVAHDDAGNSGHSAPFDLRLPQRTFTKPLARALVEQRRDLALDANAKPLVLTALDALSLAPEQFTPDTGIYLGLQDIRYQLVRAKTDDDLRAVVAQLWSMAVQIEDGDVADAQTNLRNVEQALRQALQNGASDQEIKALMDKLREAMNRYMQALADQMRNRGEPQRPLDRNARALNQHDLENMLNRLENMARSGSREAAQQMLSELEQMMENPQMASPSEGDNDQMSSELDQLGDMIRRQQDLRDRTFKQGQQRQGQGGQRQQGQPQLQQDQQALRDQLNKLLDELKKNGLGLNQQGQGQQGQDDSQAPGQGQPQGKGQGQNEMSQLGRAGRAMGQAQGALGSGDTEGAVEAQRRALDALRKGAQSLAQSMQQQMGQGQGQGRMGRLGRAGGDDDTDPLGRPLRGHEAGDDREPKVPGEIDVQRARRIIEELRKRYGEIGRPQQELDYIERLLKSF